MIRKTRRRRPPGHKQVWIPGLSGKEQSECQLCALRYVGIISCCCAAETQTTQAGKHWLIRQDSCQTAKVFPHIRGENKHAQVRKQTWSTGAPTLKLTDSPSSPLSCLDGNVSYNCARTHRHTHIHTLTLAVCHRQHHLWPPCGSLGPHYPPSPPTAPLLLRPSLTVMWPLLKMDTPTLKACTHTYTQAYRQNIRK